MPSHGLVPDVVAGNPARGKGVGTTWFLRSLRTQAMVQLCAWLGCVSWGVAFVHCGML